jgi:hypothetical protein
VDFSRASLVCYLGDASDVDIPSGVFTISDGCFALYRSIVSVTFATDCSVRLLGKWAFEGCFSLQSICIPSSVQTISEECFRYCFQLADVTFEKSSQIETIGDGAFADCSNLQSICVPSSIKTVSPTCFGRDTTLRREVVKTGCRLSRA